MDFETVSEILALCSKNNLTVCSCESLSAGLFCDTIASVSGASKVLKGGLVTYFTSMKEKLAHVDAGLIEKYGVISKECAMAMAENTRKIMEADYCVSLTGNAGPSAMENKPAGAVWCAVANSRKVKTYYFEFENQSRNDVRSAVVSAMLSRLLETVKEDLNGKKEN